MKTTIIMIRHGYSESNKNEVFTGSTNAPLTDIGFKQAEATAQYLKENYKIDKIYSSDLSRAYGTAKTCAKITGLKIIKDKKLREIFAGDWENKKFTYLMNEYPEHYGYWMKDICKCQCPNGESVAQLYTRIKNEVLKIAEENTGKTVCLFTHATPVRVIKSVATDDILKNMKDVKWCPNASVNVFEYENGQLKMTVDGYSNHLKELYTSLPENV